MTSTHTHTTVLTLDPAGRASQWFGAGCLSLHVCSTRCCAVLIDLAKDCDNGPQAKRSRPQAATHCTLAQETIDARRNGLRVQHKTAS